MSRRNKFLVKFFAILIVLVSVFLEIDVLNVNFLEPYKYWMSVLGFGFLLLVSRWLISNFKPWQVSSGINGFHNYSSKFSKIFNAFALPGFMFAVTCIEAFLRKSVFVNFDDRKRLGSEVSFWFIFIMW